MKKKLAFILYDSRSGSTLLASLLNRYKGMQVTLESAYVSRILEINKESILKDVDQLVNYLYEEVQFVELNIDKVELTVALKASTEELTKKSVIEVITSLYFKEKGSASKYWVIKHPPYNYLGELINMFPDVKFIQIVRDGRGVFNSKKRTNSIKGYAMEDNTLMAALDWKWKIEKSRKFSDHVITIKYEDLIGNTEEALSDLMDELSLSKEERELTKEQTDYFHSIGKNQKRLHKNVERLPDVKNISKWKNELAPREIKLYSYINRKMLKEMNYEVPNLNIFKVLPFYLYSFFELIFVKIINVIKLLVTPKELLIKVKRRVLLLR